MKRTKYVRPVTAETKTNIIKNSVQALSNQPALTAAELKKQFVKPIVNADGTPSAIGELDRVVAETEAAIEEVVEYVESIDPLGEEGGVTRGEFETLEAEVKKIPAVLAEALAEHYLKAETLSKEEILEAISVIPKFKIDVVEELPTSDISISSIYLLKTSDEQQNLYEEYIYVNGWEKLGLLNLGELNIDFTGYATEEYVRQYVETYAQRLGDYITVSEFETLQAKVTDVLALQSQVDAANSAAAQAVATAASAKSLADSVAKKKIIPVDQFEPVYDSVSDLVSSYAIDEKNDGLRCVARNGDRLTVYEFHYDPYVLAINMWREYADVDKDTLYLTDGALYTGYKNQQGYILITRGENSLKYVISTEWFPAFKDAYDIADITELTINVQKDYETVSFPIHSSTRKIDWGDGFSEVLDDVDGSHVYSKKGTYTIKLYGTTAFANCEMGDYGPEGGFKINGGILKKIKFSDAVTTINGWEFYRGNGLLEEVILGKGITSLENYQFNGCSALKRVVFPSSNLALGGGTFPFPSGSVAVFECMEPIELKNPSIFSSAKIIVPAEAYDAFYAKWGNEYAAQLDCYVFKSELKALEERVAALEG